MLKRIYIVWQFNIIWKTIPNKRPKYEKHLRLKALVLSGWKNFKEEFLITVFFWLVILKVLFIYWEHISEKNLKTLVERHYLNLWSIWMPNGSALLCYAMIISVQRLTQVIKSNTSRFLMIQRHNRNRKILKTIPKRQVK